MCGTSPRASITIAGESVTCSLYKYNAPENLPSQSATLSSSVQQGRSLCCRKSGNFFLNSFAHPNSFAIPTNICLMKKTQNNPSDQSSKNNYSKSQQQTTKKQNCIESQVSNYFISTRVNYDNIPIHQRNTTRAIPSPNLLPITLSLSTLPSRRYSPKIEKAPDPKGSPRR